MDVMLARTFPRGVSLARQVVLLVLLTNAVYAVALTLHLTAPPGGVAAVAFTTGVLLAGAGLGLVFHAAIAPGLPTRRRRRRVAAAAGLTLALWWPCFAWAAPGQAPWGWLAGFLVGAVVLASRWVEALCVAAVMVVFAAAGALRLGSSVIEQILTVLGSAALLVVMMNVLVWVFRLLAAAEASKESEAGLAVAEERLRLSRELHDVLGHRLGIIALKAELATDLTGPDPARARAECEAIRELAAVTLAEARAAVHGDTVPGLADQLTSAELVLSSAGCTVTVSGDAAGLSPERSHLLASVVREAVTNILRHSAAQHVTITVEGRPDTPILVIVNDGVSHRTGTTPPSAAADSRAETADPSAAADSHAGAGTGLDGLAARCAAAGARLTAGPAPDDRFEVRVSWPEPSTVRHR